MVIRFGIVHGTVPGLHMRNMQVLCRQYLGFWLSQEQSARQITGIVQLRIQTD